MIGMIYHIALQARTDDMRAAADRSAGRPPRRRLIRPSF
jgi:hypothetical protein